jgi:hypothetical protein
MEYKMIDVEGASAFSEVLNSMTENGWCPHSQHIVYMKNGVIHFTMLMSRMKPLQ